MLNSAEFLTPAIVDAAYGAAYTANIVYEELRAAKVELEQKVRQANIYERAEGDKVFVDEIAVLQKKVDSSQRIFDLLCEAAGVVMSPRS